VFHLIQPKTPHTLLRLFLYPGVRIKNTCFRPTSILGNRTLFSTSCRVDHARLLPQWGETPLVGGRCHVLLLPHGTSAIHGDCRLAPIKSESGKCFAGVTRIRAVAGKPWCPRMPNSLQIIQTRGLGVPVLKASLTVRVIHGRILFVGQLRCAS
jgi:hypothetical protein